MGIDFRLDSKCLFETIILANLSATELLFFKLSILDWKHENWNLSQMCVGQNVIIDSSW